MLHWGSEISLLPGLMIPSLKHTGDVARAWPIVRAAIRAGYSAKSAAKARSTRPLGRRSAWKLFGGGFRVSARGFQSVTDGHFKWVTCIFRTTGAVLAKGPRTRQGVAKVVRRRGRSHFLENKRVYRELRLVPRTISNY